MNVLNEIKTQYTIDFCNSNISEFFCDVDNYFVCIDSNVLKFHKEYLDDILNNATAVYVLSSLEENKNYETVNEILEMLFNDNASRSSTLVSIGGGICGDVCGFAASIFKRGMNFINIPTTLLSQVDSSIGGKVGINFCGQKNAVGSIFFPSKVIIDTHFLTTLTTRQFKSGLVEIIKHGLVVDKNIFEELEKYPGIEELKQSDMTSIIKKSVLAKKSVVETDVLDNGSRHVLNYGHSFAHAIELENDLYHGECVCLGILVNLYQSDLYDRVKAMFEKFECVKQITNFNLDSMKSDKKSSNNIINEVFLEKLGEPVIKSVDSSMLIKKYTSNYNMIKGDLKTSNSVFVFNPTVLSGEVNIPPSKSVLHRYLIASALCEEVTILKGVASLCEDVNVTINALKLLDVDVTYDQECLKIKKQRFDINSINMKESGTTLRVLLPLLMNFNEELHIEGENRLCVRPLGEYTKIFDKQNIKYSHGSNFLPLRTSGKISPGVFEIDGSISSQFVSGLLFLLPILNGDSKIVIKGKLESLPYVLLTINTLKDFGVEINYNSDYSEFNISGNQKYISKQEYFIEQDYSSRSFFEVAKSFRKHDINILNDVCNSLQGDKKVIEIVKNQISDIDLVNIPDAALILSIYLALNGGVLRNVERLKYKESDRLEAIISILDNMGIDYHLSSNDLEIKKGIISGGEFKTYNDHRVAMALIIASTISNSAIKISEIKSINKSFPTFISCYELLGGFVDEE